MKVAIEGYRFDTDKAAHHYGLAYWDDHNWHNGALYQSSNGQWYVYTPSQWANMHSWELITAAEALERYDAYLEEEDKEEISQIASLDWE